uniref:Integrase zinc-binding domain-containing protein n=1 Tax=Tanacetum cinerariifolium TaxID=118510 RepID=A0A6L2M4J7_TANCI|nr:hypothetical protein [Tanacetum cinerariifolium]
MHNNIMAAGSRDRPPMLATGRYAQWRSRFLRYIDTRPNGDALRKCILEGPYTPSTVIIPAVPAIENSPAVPERTTKWKKMKLFQGMQLIQKLRDDQKRMKKVFEVMSGSYVKKSNQNQGAQSSPEVDIRVACKREIVWKIFKMRILATRGKTNVVANASNKEWMKARRARAMSRKIHSSIMARILEAQIEASKAYGNLRTLSMNEDHTTKYFVHPRADKMYYDLRDLYWWPRMKKDISIGHDVTWVIVDQLTKSTHSLANRKDYKMEIFAWLYLNEIVARHGVPMSVISDRDRPIEIMDREVKKLKRSWIPIVKVRWNSRRGPKFTWEREDEMKHKFMNYLEEQTDGEAMINSIKNGDQLLPHVTQVFIAGTTSTEQPPLKDKSMWSDQEKRIQKIDLLARSLLIQGLPNDIYSFIDSNKTAKDLWDALARHMLGSEYGEQDRKAAVLYEYETFKATEGELLLDTYIRYLQNKNLMDINIDDLYNILKQNQGDVNDAMGSKKKTVVITSDPLALINEKTNVSRNKEKVVVSLDSEGSEVDDFSELKKITALMAKAFNRRKFYSKPTNNNLRTSSSYQSANKKQEFVKTDTKKVKKKDDEKKRDMSRVKCYNHNKEGHLAKDCKKAKVKDYEYYKTKMLLAKKDKDEQVLLAENQAWMESSSDSTYVKGECPYND